LKYFILHHLLLAFGDHFIHPNSYITLQYFSLAFGDNFTLRNSHIKHRKSIIPEGIKITGRWWSVAEPLYVNFNQCKKPEGLTRPQAGGGAK